MDTADRDRSGRPAPAPAGTLDAEDETTAGQTEGASPGAGGERPSRLRRAARSPLVRHAALLLSFVAAGMAVTWAPGAHRPLVGYLAGYLPEGRDTASYVWGFYWVAHQVTHLGNPWFTTQMAAPVGVQLGFHTLMPLPGALFTPLTLAFGPSFSYNLLVAILPGLLCYAAYRAARLWLRSATGAVAAGVFFGLSSMLTQQTWYHLNIALGALFLPLALEASVRLRRSPGRRQAVILGLVMGAAVLTDQESSVLAGIVTGLVLVPWLLRRPSWARVREAGVAVATGAVVASPQLVAMVQEIAQKGLTIPSSLLAVSYKQYGIGLPGMFTPTPRVANFGLSVLASPFLHGRDNEGMPMFGTVLTILAVCGLIAARKRLSAWLLAALWIGCSALALGTSLWIGKHQYLPLASVWNGVRVSNLMPYTWFVRIPGLSSFREADRLAILGLLPAALLAGAAVDWLRYHARPVIAVVAAAAILEAGYGGSAKVGVMPTSYPAVDSAIAADHSGSIVVDIPFGQRGGIPVNGSQFFPQALVMATADGHPRAIAYTSRLPYPTKAAILAHPFYAGLISVEHDVPMTCPWRSPHQPHSQLLCLRPPGVTPKGLVTSSATLSAADLAKAGEDAADMHIGWAVVWKRNQSVASFILPFLKATGFHFAYRTCGRHAVLVYQRSAHTVARPGCVA